jgi:hypothetical protein
MISSLKRFSDDEALRDFSEPVVKIPLNPPLLKGGLKWVLPLGKGELEGILSEVLTQLGC